MATEAKPRCKAHVWHDYHQDQCTRAAKRDGWCSQHHPDAEKERRSIAHEKWEKRRAASPAAEVARLRAALARVRNALEGDIVEYDDVTNMLDTINAALLAKDPTDAD